MTSEDTRASVALYTCCLRTLKVPVTCKKGNVVISRKKGDVKEVKEVKS